MESFQALDLVAYGIVVVAVVTLARGFFRNYLVSPLATFLLRKNYVRWAMWIRGGGTKKGGCASCSSCS